MDGVVEFDDHVARVVQVAEWTVFKEFIVPSCAYLFCADVEVFEDFVFVEGRTEVSSPKARSELGWSSRSHIALMLTSLKLRSNTLKIL